MSGSKPAAIASSRVLRSTMSARIVAVGHRLEVVMQLVVAGGVIELPDQVAVPIILLEASALAAARAALHAQHAGAHHVAIRQQIDDCPGS